MKQRVNEKTGIVYGITNLKNNKIYIGQTIRTLKERWQGHLRSARENETQPIAQAIRKYGKESFIIYPIETDVPKNLLKEIEGRWIFRLRTLISQNGYNVFTSGKNERIKITDDSKIIQTYLEVKSIRKTAEILQISRDIVSHRIKSANIEIFTPAETKGVAVKVVTPNKEVKHFPSKKCLANWLVKNSIGKSKSTETLRKRFTKGTEEYFGYLITVEK